MIITLIGIGVILLAIISFILHVVTGKFIFTCLASTTIPIGFVLFVSCVTIICCEYIAVEKQINTYQMDYDCLVKQVEVINSDYEDISKTTVIQKVTDWNKKVYSRKYLSENIWTNWLINKRIANTLKYIELEGEKR